MNLDGQKKLKQIYLKILVPGQEMPCLVYENKNTKKLSILSGCAFILWLPLKVYFCAWCKISIPLKMLSIKVLV